MQPLIGIFLLLSANNSNIVIQDSMIEAYDSADLALKSIKDAEYSGANISMVTEKFNNALELLQQATHLVTALASTMTTV
jgi:hypothetical protein